jgi:formiminotetrahydrofolate cyclodeaminase
METLRFSYDAILLHQDIVDKSSKNIISDVGVGVQFLKAALNSAYLNVLINLNLIDDENYVKVHKEEAEKLLDMGRKIADEVYEKAVTILNQ